MNVRDINAQRNSDNWAQTASSSSLYHERARQRLQGLQNTFDHLLGVTKQHHGVVPEEQFIVDAGIA